MTAGGRRSGRTEAPRDRAPHPSVLRLHGGAPLTVMLLMAWLSVADASFAPPPPPPPPGAGNPFEFPPREVELYDRLGVPFNASMREVGQAYRRKAVALHPDKHDNDPSMAQEFKAVTEAYEVLGSLEARTRYHMYGQGGVLAGQQQPQKSHLEITLERHFGDGRFKHLIGDLPTNLLVLPARNGVSFESFDNEARIAELAERLKDRLQLYVSGQFSEFERSVFEEAQGLRGESMGPQLLATLGYVYERCGRRALSRLQLGRSRGGYVSMTHNVRSKAHVLGNYVSCFGSGMRLLMRLRTQTRVDPQVLPRLLDTLWRMNRVEIERTVTAVCKRVTREPSATLAELEMRAKGLVALGQIFAACARMPPGPV